MLLPFTLVGQSRLNAVVETKRFYEPGNGELVDVNISVIGGTALWTMDERGFQQAKVEALTVIGQDGRIVDFRKTLVRSPERADTLQSDFIHQERFVLQPGAYALTLELHDANLADTARTYVHTPLVVPARGNDVTLSDIMFTLPGPDGKGIAPFRHLLSIGNGQARFLCGGVRHARQVRRERCVRDIGTNREL